VSAIEGIERGLATRGRHVLAQRGGKLVNRTVAGCLLIALAGAAGAGCAEPGNSDKEPGQRVEWLGRKAARVRSIDLADDDFADLEPLARAVGDARIILLGEASHGDGATFLAKGRLIRFLHQRLGSDVLVWESGFYECDKAAEALAAGVSWREAFGKAVLPIWANSEQCRPVMEYVQATQQTDRPITLAGLGWYVSDQTKLFDDLIAFFEAVDPTWPSPDQRQALASIQTMLDTRGDRSRPPKPIEPPELVQLRALADLLDRDSAGRVSAMHGRRRIGFMRRVLENLEAYVVYLNSPPTRGGADDNPLGMIEGHNAVFLASEYFPNRKLIVWAHNGHLTRGSSQIEELESKFRINQTIAAGQHIHNDLGDGVYSIMFITHNGQTGLWWNEPAELPAPPVGSLEDLMHRVGLEHGFVDLRSLPRDHWLRSRLIAHPLAHRPMRADWSRVYDGVFFIDTMSPSTSADPDD